MRIVRKSLQSTGPTLPGMEISESVEHTTSNPLISFVAASPARTSAMQANEQELKANVVDSGKSSTVSFANYNLSTSSWKTQQICLNGDLEEFSETWPELGIMQNGECYQQRNLEHGISEDEFSLLPTPTASNMTLPRNPQSILRQAQKHHLNGYVALFPTPTATDYKRATRNINYFLGRRKAGWKSSLPQYIALSSEGQSPSGIYGQMNPTWLEWLMGFPTGWTELEDSETP